MYQIGAISLYAASDTPIIYSSILPDNLGWYTRETLPFVEIFSWIQVAFMVINIIVAIWFWSSAQRGIRPVFDFK